MEQESNTTKIDYIHNKLVASGFVTKPQYWGYSSAVNFNGIKSIVEIDEL